MIDKRIQYRVGGASGREYDQGGNRNTRSTKSNPNMGGGGGRDLGRGPIGPVAPPTTFIGGEQFNVTPFNRDERERADLKARLMKGPVSGNFDRVDPITGQSKRSVGSGLGSLLGTVLGLITGNPLVGLALGGFDRLKRFNQRLQNTDFGKSKGLMDFLDMRKYGGYDEREEARRLNMEQTGILQGLIDEGQFGLPTSNRERALLGIPTIMNKPIINNQIDYGNPLGDNRIVPEEQGLEGDGSFNMSSALPANNLVSDLNPAFRNMVTRTGGLQDPVTTKLNEQKSKIEAIQKSDAFEYLSDEQKDQLQKDLNKIIQDLNLKQVATSIKT